MLKENCKIYYEYFKSYLKLFVKNETVEFDYNQKYAFIFFAADYNNLGDIAITIAQEKFLNECLNNEYKIIKVNVNDTYRWLHSIKKLPLENVLITLIGGGNSGSLYDFIEIPRRFLIKYLKKFKIVSFPQTVIFEENQRAFAQKKYFKKVVESCNDITLVAREKSSEEAYKKFIQSKRILLTPDIVFSYEKYVKKNNTRINNSVALILRKDKEKSINDDFVKQLKIYIHNRFDVVEYCDTCDIEYHYDNSEKLLQDYLLKLQTMELVITDRLHGMILCYITKTPCIVFTNNNWKIKSTYYTWLLNQDLISLFEFENRGMEELKLLINEKINKKYSNYICLEDKFDSLKKCLGEEYYG